MLYVIRVSVLGLLALLPIVSSAQNPTDAERLFARGEEYLQANEYTDAIKQFEKAISLKPDFAQAYFKLGVAHLSLGKYDDAAASFKQAIKIKPDFADAHTKLAIVHLYKQEHREGIERLKEAIRIRSDLALAHKLLALAYLAVDDRDQAMQEYNILKPLDQEMASFVLAAIQRPEKFVFGLVQGKLISSPKPEYPIEARKDHVSGRVTVQVEINTEGKVTKTRAVSGPPELRAAAEAAARGARFIPNRLSGQAVKGTGVIYYDFVEE